MVGRVSVWGKGADASERPYLNTANGDSGGPGEKNCRRGGGAFSYWFLRMAPAAGRRLRRRPAFSFFISMLRQILIGLAAGLGGAAGLCAQTLQVAGSDLLQVAVGEPLAQYAQKTGLDLKVDFSGTVPALAQLQDDKVQLAVIAAPAGQQPTAKGLVVLAYAYQVAYILVNPDNPITEVDRDELMGVFGTVDTDVTQWSQLGLAGEWSDRPVLAVCTSNDDGVVQELFKHVMLGGTPMKPGVTLLKSGMDLPKMIGDNPNIIAIGRYAPDGSKALYVSFERSASSSVPEDGNGDAGDGGDRAGVAPGGSKVVVCADGGECLPRGLSAAAAVLHCLQGGEQGEGAAICCRCCLARNSRGICGTSISCRCRTRSGSGLCWSLTTRSSVAGWIAYRLPEAFRRTRRERSSVGRALPCQGRCRGFESLRSLHFFGARGWGRRGGTVSIYKS